MTTRKITVNMTDEVYERFVALCDLHGVTHGALLEAWVIELTEPPTRRTELRLVSERRGAAVRWARKIDASRRKRESNGTTSAQDQQ